MRYLPALVAMTFSGLGVGCQVIEYHPPDPVTTEDILRMTEAATPPDVIITKIKESGTVYRMDSDDVIQLHEQGVDKEVINYMLKTERLDRRRDYYYYGPHYHGAHYYYRPHYYGWWCY